MENERSGMTVAEIVAEFMDRMLGLAEENADLRAERAMLFRIVKAEELRDAEYQVKKTYGEPDYDGSIKTETINLIMGWNRNKDATKLVEDELARRRKAERAEKEKARKEAEENGDAE